LEFAVAQQLRPHPGGRRIAVDQQQGLAVDEVGFEVLSDLRGRALEQRPRSRAIPSVLEKLEEAVGEFLVASIGIEEEMTVTLRFGLRVGFGFLLSLVAPDDLGFEFLKTDRGDLWSVE